MRPLELQIEGFTSFRDKQEIPFEDFDLFVITGPTGAGKTSVLDAIALALYGRVPRMGKHGLGELVSHGSAEARIQLDFSVNGQSYRVARRLPRSGAQTGRLQRDEGGEWVDAVDGSGITAVNRAVLDLVKLDFESFCKAVLLPQGEFAEFLKGDQTERRNTLVRLLGLDYFRRMREIAGARARDLSSKDEQTEKILAEQFDDATAEAVAGARAIAKEAKAHAKALRDLLTQARGVEAARSTAGEKEERLERLAESAIDLREELESGIEECRQAQEELDAARKEKQSQHTVVKSAEARLSNAGRARDRVIERVGNHDELAAAATAAEQRAGLEKRAEKALKDVGDAAARATKLKESAAKAVSAFKDAKKQTAVASKAAERAVRRHTTLAEREEELTRALGGARQELAAVKRGEKEAKAARGRLGKAESVLNLTREKREELRATFELVRREHSVVELAGALAAGDPCPVCERPLEEAPAVDTHAQEQLEKARASLEAAEEELESAAQAQADAASEVATLDSRLDDARRRLKGQLGQHHDVDALAEAAEQAASAAAEASSEADTASEALREAEEAKHAAELAERAAQHKVEAHDEKADLLGKSLAEAERALDDVVAVLCSRFGQRIPADAAERIAADRKDITAADQELENANDDAARARKELNEAQERLNSAERRVNEIDVSLVKSRERAEGLVLDVKQAAPSVVLRVLPKEAKARDSRSQTLAAWCAGAADLLEAAADEAGAAAVEAADRLVTLAEENELGRPAAAEAHEVIEQAEEGARDERVRADEAAKQLADRLKRRKQLEKELEENREARSVLDVLAKELRADRFVDFVINETLELLAVRASEELLRVSGDRYSLVTEDAHFSVVDHTNADERRSVRTLSGGETFLASLALALALSKHVTELAGEGLGARLEAVFIDEGFGTLDPETLDEVIDALERVREEDVLVGAISHRSELAERIRTGLEVRKDGNRSVVVVT